MQAYTLFYQFKDYSDMFSLLSSGKSVITMLFLIAVTACSVMPAQQMSDARQAMQAADQVNAREKAPQKYQEARRLLDQAQAEIRMKNYQEAQRLADAAKKAALEAHNLAVQQ